mgnify:CR=1 FL=1
MKLKLFHGRDKQDEDMDDWGYDGPTLEIIAMHTTYLNHIRVKCATKGKTEDMQLQTGWKIIDENWLELNLVDDMVECSGKFYGDFNVEDNQ